MRTFLFTSLIFAISLMAQENPSNVRNVCDTLRIGDSIEERTMKISLDTIYDLRYENETLVSSSFYRSIDSVVSIRANDAISSFLIPVSIEAQCLKSSNSCSMAFFNKQTKKWAVKDTTCMTQIFDIHESPFDSYDSSNAYNWILSRFDDWNNNDPIDQSNMLLSVTQDLRAVSWLTIAYVVDTVNSKNIYYTSVSKSMDSLASVTAALEALSDKDNSVKYRQMLKIVLAEERLIEKDEPPTRLNESIQNPRPHFSLLKTYGGVLIRGPKGEIPQLRYLNGTFVSGEKPVSAGVYFISIQKGSWHRILIQD